MEVIRHMQRQSQEQMPLNLHYSTSCMRLVLWRISLSVYARASPPMTSIWCYSNLQQHQMLLHSPTQEWFSFVCLKMHSMCPFSWQCLVHPLFSPWHCTLQLHKLRLLKEHIKGKCFWHKDEMKSSCICRYKHVLIAYAHWNEYTVNYILITNFRALIIIYS